MGTVIRLSLLVSKRNDGEVKEIIECWKQDRNALVRIKVILRLGTVLNGIITITILDFML